jgi:hypothetical protein
MYGQQIVHEQTDFYLWHLYETRHGIFGCVHDALWSFMASDIDVMRHHNMVVGGI